MIKRIGVLFTTIDRKPAVQYGLLALLTLFASVLRFYKIDDWSFWVDEIYTNQRVNDLLQHDLLYGLLNHSISLKLGALFAFVMPIDELGSRIVPALIGIIAIPVLFFPIRRIFGAPVALITVLLLAFSPWHLYWSQNARFYTAQLLFYTLSLLYFYLAVEEQRRSYFAVSGLFFILACWERMTSAFAIPTVACYIVLLFLTRPSFSPMEFYKSTSRYILPIVFVPVFIGVYDIFGSPYFGQNSSIVSFFNIFVGYTNSNPLRLTMAIAYRIGLPIFCLGLGAAVYLAMFQRSPRTWFLLLATFVPLAGILFVSLFSFAVDRYVFISLPFWLMLCAVALQALFTQAERYAPVLAMAVLALVLADSTSNNLQYFQYQNGNRLDVGGAYALVSERKSPEALVVTTGHGEIVGEYYMPGTDVHSYSDIDLAVLEQNKQPAWFVVESDVGWTPPAVQTWLDTNANLVSVRDIYLPGKPVRLRVYAYGEQ